ncbi:MAG: glycerate kinase [Olleya sp.]
MKIIIAPDKFKGSITGLEFCNVVKESVKKVLPDAKILNLPLADGGDGTIEVVNYYLKGNWISLEVNNPFFKTIKASYLFSDSTKTAFIEMAEASGLKLLNPQAFDCKNATTYGTGQLILDALNKGAKHIILGIGGSATNDCGIGMATALGYQFLDINNKQIKPIGANLSKINSINLTKINPKLKNVSFDIACDVTNPLYGKNGAAYIYGKQKGATDGDVKMLDKGLEDFSKIITAQFQIDPQTVSGAGAAGGMGIASKIFLNGNLERGINLIKKLANFDTQIEGADWIITGEGKLDNQTLSGKTIQGVIDSAKAKKIKVAAFCGVIEINEKELLDLGISYYDSIVDYSKSIEDGFKNVYQYLQKISEIFSQKIY